MHYIGLYSQTKWKVGAWKTKKRRERPNLRLRSRSLAENKLDKIKRKICLKACNITAKFSSENPKEEIFRRFKNE
jgi:hypothetical protein